MVGAQYFRTLKTPLLAGREFEDRDMGTTAKLAVVNEEFARQFTGGTNPVGRRFWIETTPTVPQAFMKLSGSRATQSIRICANRSSQRCLYQ